MVEVADDVDGWRAGDRAMALLAGGGYAEEVVVHAGSALRVPDCVSLLEAAALPEVFLTVYLNVFQLGGPSRRRGRFSCTGGAAVLGQLRFKCSRRWDLPSW